jgi:uncharacterized protein YdiU (UPF0061 family)
MKKGALVLVGVLCALFVLLVIVGMGISYNNRYVQLNNLASAQEKANEIIFDSVWKIISQKAQIADKYKDSFNKIYADLMAGRYGNDNGQLMKWVQESNPQFDSSVFKSIMDTVQGKREEFASVQIKLRDIKRESDNLRQMFPSSLFVGGKPELKVKIVTSEKTDSVFNAGKEDDIKVF